MSHLAKACAVVLLLSLVGPATAAQTTGAAPQGTTLQVKPVGPTGGVKGTHPGVVELNASDCRLDGGKVIVPGDNRCGKLNAPYCRKPNGEAACLTEQ